jgi:hypothetical protein
LSYAKKIWWLIGIATVIRLVIAVTTELGNDEVYYWTYALHLQWNYFDHPPMVGLLIRLTTANLFFHSEVFVRLGAIVASGICTYLMYSIGSFIRNERTGWFAALLYTSSLYCSIIAGTFILPDSPQMIFWLWSILLVLKIKAAHQQNKPLLALWLWFGIAAGICVMCKVHGAFLWFGVGMYALFIDRKWLSMKAMYIAAIISIAIASPILIWNIQNNFITYTYHGNRVALQNAGFNIESLSREILGSFFYNNPINFILVWGAIFQLKKLDADRKLARLILLLGLPLVLVLIGVSFFRDTFPHWSGPGYSCLLLLAAIRLDTKISLPNLMPKILKASLALIFVVAISGIGLIQFYPGTLSTNQGNNLGEGDFTLDMYGWQQFGIKMDSLYKADTAQHLMQASSQILIHKWFPAAHIDFYVASKTKQTTYALGKLTNLHHYYWLNAYKPSSLKQHDDAYCIMPSNNFDEAVLNYYKQQFESALPTLTIPIYRSGVLSKQYFVYRLKSYKGK